MNRIEFHGLAKAVGVRVAFEHVAAASAKTGVQLSPPETPRYWHALGVLALALVAEGRELPRATELYGQAVRGGLSNGPQFAVRCALKWGFWAYERGAVTQALESIAAQTPIAARFHQVVLTAPDIDVRVFRQLVPRMAPAAERITLYASSLRPARSAMGDYWEFKA